MAALNENVERQAEELEALSAIYGPELHVLDGERRVVSFHGSCADGRILHLQMTLPPEYPSNAPPLYQLSCAWLSQQQLYSLGCSLEQIYSEHLGESMVHLWVEQLREFLQKLESTDEPGTGSQTGRGDYDEAEFDQDADDFDDGNLSLKLLDTISIYHNTADQPLMPVLTHGEPLTDRRSTFQAHLAPVVKTEQVQQVVARLKETRKIATATHNIMAYRIWSAERKVFLQDCDDDGEAAAGGRLLHLLQVLDARDVVVVVSRWFGGILLGPDRFKHINNCARNLLLVQGYLSSSTKGVTDFTKARKAKGKKTKH
uniref:Impact RWD domain protein n=1 Tax=Eptatretus burgeri TaxID=7764 RepID=A0A8C4N6Z4_EPTBU